MLHINFIILNDIESGERRKLGVDIFEEYLYFNGCNASAKWKIKPLFLLKLPSKGLNPYLEQGKGCGCALPPSSMAGYFMGTKYVPRICMNSLDFKHSRIFR